MPIIDTYLMRKKYEDLKKGKDDLAYIEEAVRNRKKHSRLMDHLRKKFDYRTKKVVNPRLHSKEELEKMRQYSPQNLIIGFESHFEEQIRTKKKKVSKFELLRAHIKNYQMLTQKEKRMVLGYIGARRARDSRKEFRKELSLLAQKIFHENREKEEQEAQNMQV